MINMAMLHHEMRERIEEFINHCNGARFDVLLYCGKRTLEEQSRLYRNGRSYLDISQKADELRNHWHRGDLADILIGVGPQNGKSIVTNAGPGQSMHNYGMAVDGVPMRDGKPVWGNKEPEDLDRWEQYGHLAMGAGLEWAGNWTHFKEFPHIQLPNHDWRELIKTMAVW